MKILSCFPSKYLKAADIGERKITATMDYVALEDIGEPDPKPILYFNNCAKGMVLNKTNAKTIMTAYGEETDNWRGKTIILFAAMVDFRGDTVEALRVKVPTAAADVPKVLKKDTRDLYTALMTEMDEAASSVQDLRAWGNAAISRIRQLPADWQLSLSSLQMKKINELIDGKPSTPCAEILADQWGEQQGGGMLRAMRSTVDHDADGVVREPPLDHTDVNGIPTFLARQPNSSRDIVFAGQ